LFKEAYQTYTLPSCFLFINEKRNNTNNKTITTKDSKEIPGADDRRIEKSY
jgi:hypothetical protein